MLMTSTQERLNQVGHLLAFVFYFCAKETPFLGRRHNSRWTHSPRNSAVKQNGGVFGVIFETSPGHRKSKIQPNPNF